MKETPVYVVDDDADLGASVARLLGRHGFAAQAFVDPAALLGLYAAAPAQCIVTDVMMGDLDGFAFADRVRANVRVRIHELRPERRERGVYVPEEVGPAPFVAELLGGRRVEPRA